MALPVFRYPLDKNGTNPSNFVSREPHSLTPVQRPTDVRVACPIYGPFFNERGSLSVRDRANGVTLAYGVDYKVTDLLLDPTLNFGKPIGQWIVIQTATVSNEIEISYQVLGGNYQNDATAVQHVYQTFLNDTRPVDWSNISGKPDTFPPSLHMHLLEDVVGWGPVIVALDNVANCITLSNTPVFEAVIDWVNTRKTPWSSLIDVPPGTSEESLNQLVKKSYRIETPVEGGLEGGSDLNQDMTLSLGLSGVVDGIYGTSAYTPRFNVDPYGRVTWCTNVLIKPSWFDVVDKPTTVEEFGIRDIVPTSRRVDTAFNSGLTGGGDLQYNLNLAIVDSGVSQGSYGSSTYAVNFTVNAKGQVTDAGSTLITPAFENVTDLPTTVEGYGILDGVSYARKINTPESGGLIGGGDLSQDLDISLQEVNAQPGAYGGPIRNMSIVVDKYGRITGIEDATQIVTWDSLNGKPSTLAGFGIVDAVENTREITAGVGLIGGGNLQANRTIDLANTPVLPGTYGSANDVPVFEVDQQGRIVSATTAPFSRSWGSITGKPTSLLGYGITDAVALAGDQVISGAKSFRNLLAGLGSVAANLDDSESSPIVSDDYMRRYIRSVMNTGTTGTAVMTFGNYTIVSGRITRPAGVVWFNRQIIATLPVRFVSSASLVAGVPCTQVYTGTTPNPDPVRVQGMVTLNCFEGNELHLEIHGADADNTNASILNDADTLLYTIGGFTS